MCLSFSITLLLRIIIIVDANNFEGDSFVDDTPQAVAKYVVDQLVTSVTESVGKCRDLIFKLSMCLLAYVKLTLFSVMLVSTLFNQLQCYINISSAACTLIAICCMLWTVLPISQRN